MTTVAQQLAAENLRFEQALDPMSKPMHLPPSGLIPDGRAPWWKYAPRRTHHKSGGWCVWRTWGTTKAQRKIFRGYMDEATARDFASWCRDHCPDKEVGAGVNYLPGRPSGPAPIGGIA